MPFLLQAVGVMDTPEIVQVLSLRLDVLVLMGNWSFIFPVFNCGIPQDSILPLNIQHIKTQEKNVTQNGLKCQQKENDSQLFVSFMPNINHYLPAFSVPSQNQHWDDRQMVKVEPRMMLVVGRLLEEVVSSRIIPLY